MAEDRLAFEVVHPAAVTYVPVRGRVERTELMRITTPVTVRRVEEDVFEPIAAWDGPSRTYRHGGHYWSRLARGPSGEMPFTPAEFFDALASGKAPTLPILAKAMRGTPLLGWGDLGSAYARHEASPLSSGNPVDLDGARRIARDGRAEAATALLRHLDDEYRFTRDAIYRKRVPMASVYPGETSVVDLVTVRSPSAQASDFLASPTTYPDMMRLGRSRNSSTKEGETIARWLAVAREDGDPILGQEHRAIANSWPGWLRRRCQAQRAAHPGPGNEELDGVQASLFALEVAGLTGTCGELDLERPLRQIRDALIFLGQFSPLAGTAHREPALEALETVYLPSLPAPAIKDEDVEALDSLDRGLGR